MASGVRSAFVRGEYPMPNHESLRKGVALCAAKRRLSLNLFVKSAGSTIGLGQFASGQGTLMLKQSLPLFAFHRFRFEVADLMLDGGRGPASTVPEIGQTLRTSMQRRGLSVTKAVEAFGGSGSTAGVMTGRSDNMRSDMLFRILEHYGLKLVIVDELAPAIRNGK